MRYPQIDPVLVHLGPLQIRWYGLMYIIGFACAYFIVRDICKRRSYDLSRADIEDLFAYCILALILGARLGYCLFYNLTYYLENPLKILAVWEGGMSFHGGLLGLILAGWIFSLKRDKSFPMLTDLGAVAAPPGLFFGRMGNFINGELFGRVTDSAWGMVFPAGGSLPRYPSQLFEAFFEGLVLFVIMYGLSFKTRMHGTLLAAFLICYGAMRFGLEYFREPDAQLGFVIMSAITMGQMLCLVMIICGLSLLVFLRTRSGKNQPSG